MNVVIISMHVKCVRVVNETSLDLVLNALQMWIAELGSILPRRVFLQLALFKVKLCGR